jgi:hypothetical protein
MSNDGWDQTRFDVVLAEELTHTKRTYVEALNQHAYYIARKALWHTHKADRATIESQLTAQPRYAQGLDTLAEAILMARYNAQGGWPTSGAEFESAARKLIAARVRSIAFLKSGWIPAIRILETFVTSKSGAAPIDRDAKVYGAEKGSAYPAVDGEQMVARIVNEAVAKGDEGGKALLKWGGEGLDTAFYDEIQRMLDYIERKVREQFEKANERL